ncbi:vanillin synthase /trans-feruloyl-CoA hydratase [Rhodobacter aestuarii]|uniref:Enoyl-CoA hydratase/carnithine racemase n=1 Tax=Rhodobacter aestuarii TaxID=453582 RepID=A0A1N7IZG2_9RHOB|nr:MULTISPECIES: crotonase/enoyl-CoA hydratase family protein [Rhodobacter]PTV97356.1 vanillin synthase /trans-feruloyl-CoA hydratase [Rhodobacter aestuarii]SIS42407.1 Enoyl-CoA hydratase/carnithine racemase [Rhodobacter aestuarii]SOC00054.1 vanillin synthase /trans-feruloyl-CoA hydratase [Rhodobacter sp. JA431]
MNRPMTRPLLDIALEGPIATLTMNRPGKRNAMCDGLLAEIEAFFATPPKGLRAIILTGTEGHFCSGLDLSEHVQRDAEGTMRHSRNWHRVMDMVQFSGVPVVSALFGAVIGGGLELATATHVRVAEPSTRFQLPEGRRGIFVGGGATVRVGRILGADRMCEMMLTGRSYSAEEGLRLGLAHYLVGEGEALAEARRLAERIAENAQLSNFMMIQALSRIDDMPRQDGLFAESLCAAVSQTSLDAEEGLRAFLEKRSPKFR